MKLFNAVFISFIVISVFIFLCIITPTHPPIMHSDSYEYLAMTVSIANKMSVAIDQDTFNYIAANFHETPFSGYVNPVGGYSTALAHGKGGNNYPFTFFLSNNGKLISWHFWLYPLINVPMFLLTKAFGVNIMYSFLLTNYIILAFTATFILHIIKSLDLAKKTLIMFLIFLNPIIKYILWAHPEYFEFSMLAISLAAFCVNRYTVAILFSAIAAAQMPLIAIITLFFCASFFYDTVFCKWKECVKNTTNKHDYKGQFQLLQQQLSQHRSKIITNALTSCLALIQPIYYKLNFGVYSIIEREDFFSVLNITAKRFFSIFNDLNQGIIIFYPIGFLISIFGIYKYLQKCGALKFALLALTISLVCIVTCGQLVWNPGYDGIIRYASYIIPAILIGFFGVIKTITVGKKVVISICLIHLTLTLIVGTSVFVPIGEMHSSFAKFVLDKAPWLYNPEPEIFASRAQSRHKMNKFEEDDIIVNYVNNNLPNKIMVYNPQKAVQSRNLALKLPPIFDIKKLQQYLQKNFADKTAPVYINLSQTEAFINSDLLRLYKLKIGKDIGIKNLNRKDGVSINCMKPFKNEHNQIVMRYRISNFTNNRLYIGQNNNSVGIFLISINDNGLTLKVSELPVQHYIMPNFYKSFDVNIRTIKSLASNKEDNRVKVIMLIADRSEIAKLKNKKSPEKLLNMYYKNELQDGKKSSVCNLIVS